MTPPPRPLWVRGVNSVRPRLARFGRSGLELDAADLLELARHRSRSDAVDADAVEPVTVLVESLNRDAALTPFGRRFARMLVLDTLLTRARVARAVERTPQIATTRIARPVVIVGMARTGTTLLHRLLALDPSLRAPHYWEAAWPVPSERGPDLRRLGARAQIRQLHRISPDLRSIHAIEAVGPEEDLAMLSLSLRSPLFSLFFNVPGYWEWLRARPSSEMLDAYRLHRTMLACLQHAEGGDSRSWLLKTPAHCLFVSELIETFPDVALIQTSRELTSVIPSLASLIGATRWVATDEVDAHELGRLALDITALSLERVAAARARSPERFFDLAYADLTGDPIGSVSRLYEAMGRELTDDVHARMEHYLTQNPRHKHGVHRYTLEQFGLDEAMIEERVSQTRPEAPSAT